MEKAVVARLPKATSRRFRAIAEAVVPGSAEMPAEEWLEAEAIIAGALASRAPSIQRQVRIFLRLLDVLALLRSGRRLHRLTLHPRTRFLQSIEDSRLLLFRRGFWGVRTLVLMGYYARPTAARRIGYRAHPSGWDARS
jgi:hypothetical protein